MERRTTILLALSMILSLASASRAIRSMKLPGMVHQVEIHFHFQADGGTAKTVVGLAYFT